MVSNPLTHLNMIPGNTCRVILALLLASAPITFAIQPDFATEAVPHDIDDPAVWVNRADPAKSLILGTDKEKAPLGGVYAFDLDGKIVQRITGVDRPNNIDVAYSLRTASGSIDIAVAAERFQNQLRVWSIAPSTGLLSDVTGSTKVFEGDKDEFAMPMGVSTYRRRDGRIFAVVSRKTGPRFGYLHQYELVANAQGEVDLRFVRAFGEFSTKKEIEAIAVDSWANVIYYSDETVGLRKYPADPDARKSNEPLAFFRTSGFEGDHEGLAIYADKGGRGYFVSTDQIDGDSKYYVYRRRHAGEGRDSQPIAVFTGGADQTDGIEISSAALGTKFPKGLFIAMNSKDKNFLVYDWRKIAARLPASN